MNSIKIMSQQHQKRVIICLKHSHLQMDWTGRKKKAQLVAITIVERIQIFIEDLPDETFAEKAKTEKQTKKPNRLKMTDGGGAGRAPVRSKPQSTSYKVDRKRREEKRHTKAWNNVQRPQQARKQAVSMNKFLTIKQLKERSFILTYF